jgi:hypothetical protein
MLTTAQLATLKTDIQAQGTLAAAVSAADWQTVAAFYNANSSSAIWLPSVPVATLASAIDWSTTALTGGNGGFQSLAQAARDAYFALTQGGSVDATQTNVRNGFSSIFPANVASALAAVAQRTATRLEVLFGSGGPPVVSALFGYQVTASEVQKAMGA